MDFEELIEYINSKIKPYCLNDDGKKTVANMYNKYPTALILECIEIGIKQYLLYDANNQPTKDSILIFWDKLGGILHNKSKNPIEQEILHIQGVAQKKFAYWNRNRAVELLQDYIDALRSNKWTDKQILEDLQNDVMRITNRSKNWSQWSNNIIKWIKDLSEETDETTSIVQEGTILPDTLISVMPEYLKRLSQQINASYESNLFDCTAVIMRRVLEILLILSYQNNGIESEIMDASGKYSFSLDKIIRNAETNTTLSLSAGTKKDMIIFKDLGNFSAHKIWYNCTQQDIQHHLLKYRALIEELLYKSGIK